MQASAPKRRGALVLGVVAGGLLAACGSSKPPLKPADDLHAQAQGYHEEEYYDAAIESYKQLLDNYPLDPRAEEIELKIAQAHYANESYPEAIAAFSDFQRMHPTSPRLPEVEYSIGQAYSDQMTTIDRDLAAATNAAQRYESVIARYPRSEYAEKAAEKLADARAHLAEREFYVASFYYGRGKTRAARGRILEVLTRYPETPAARDALARVGDDAAATDDAELKALVEAALAEQGPEEQDAPPPKPGAVVARPATAAVARALRERQSRPDPDPSTVADASSKSAP